MEAAARGAHGLTLRPLPVALGAAVLPVGASALVTTSGGGGVPGHRRRRAWPSLLLGRNLEGPYPSLPLVF